MDIKEIISKCDHTILSQTATFKDVKVLLDDGIKYGVASCCIPPCFVKEAKSYVQDKLKICTVIGFPNGYNQTSVKVYETSQAVLDGADEIDMVINIGKLKDKDYKYLEDEILQIKKACSGKVLKVIVETCLLTTEEKLEICKILSNLKVDFIKTSTGFSSGGATFEDIELFSKNINNEMKIKASGGISSLQDAEKFINLGASRLGTSKIIKLVKEKEQKLWVFQHHI